MLELSFTRKKQKMKGKELITWIAMVSTSTNLHNDTDSRKNELQGLMKNLV